MLTTQDITGPLMAGFQTGKPGCREHQRAIAIKGLLLFRLGLCSIRGGMILKNPATRASQSREGGLSLEPGGLKSLDKRGDGTAPKSQKRTFYTVRASFAQKLTKITQIKTYKQRLK